MLVKTRNSTYEFDENTSCFRRILPTMDSWEPYIGLVCDPKVGEKLQIIRNIEQRVVTSTVREIIEDA